ncbi:MAG: hypothetical protein P1U40_11610 [Coxiellaceae bacterium]|nr:hypothetical protein [Coxiellaceae bacterium]
MSKRGCILACALSIAAIAAGTLYADNKPVFETGVQASYFAINSHGHSKYMFLALDNVNNKTDASGCTGSSVPMPIRAPRLRIDASASRQLQFTQFHSDDGGICLQAGVSSGSFLIPGVTDQEPLKVPSNLSSNQNLTYVFITFNDQHEHLSATGYQRANNLAQNMCQKAINNARPKVISGTCYAIPKYNSNRNAGYYAVMTQLSS